jgi:SnoaL-like polyketide cyclase
VSAENKSLTRRLEEQATVEDVIAEDDKVVTRITLTGTHQGPLMGCAGDRQVGGSHGNHDQPIRRRKARRNMEHLRHGGSAQPDRRTPLGFQYVKGFITTWKRRGREL